MIPTEPSPTVDRKLFYQVAEGEVEHALTKSLRQGFNHLYTSAAVDGFSPQILQMLDRGETWVVVGDCDSGVACCGGL